MTDRPPDTRRPRPRRHTGNEATNENTPDHYSLPPPLVWWAIATGTGYGLILLAALLGMSGFFDHVELVTVPPVAEVAHHE